MTLTFPLALADFWDQLLISTISMAPEDQSETSGVASGQILTREVAPALWRGTVTLGRLTPSEAADIAPLIDLVRRPGSSFLACDLKRGYPQLDPVGAVLGAATIVVDTVAASGREIILAGLPPNYPLSRGDLIGVTWGSGPVRYGLHRIVVPSSADVTGRTGWNEVTPPYSPALQSGDVAVLGRPVIKALIVPGTVQPGTLRSGLVEGIGFSFTQTLR